MEVGMNKDTLKHIMENVKGDAIIHIIFDKEDKKGSKETCKNKK